MNSGQNFNLRGSIRNLCDHPVFLETKARSETTQFVHEGRILLDITQCEHFTDPTASSIGTINNLIPLYAPSPERKEISLAEIANAPYLNEFPNDPKHGPAVFYIVPRVFLCYALGRRWDFASRLLVLERTPPVSTSESINDIKIYDPKEKKRPTGRLVSAMSYEAPPNSAIGYKTAIYRSSSSQEPKTKNTPISPLSRGVSFLRPKPPNQNPEANPKSLQLLQ